MDCARRFFNSLLQRKTRIVQPTLIEELKGAVRRKAPGHRRNCVDDKPSAIFGLFHRLYCQFALGDFRSERFIGGGKFSGPFPYFLLQFVESCHF